MGASEIETVGIVLRRFDYGDSSQIAHLHCPDAGRLAVLAKAIKRPNPYLKGPFDLFQLGRLAYLPGRESDLGLLKRWEPITGFSGLRRSLPALYAAFYLVDLFWEAARENVADPAGFQLLARALGALEEQGVGVASAVVLASEMGLLAASGQAPALESCASCGRAAPSGAFRLHPQAGGWVCERCPRPRGPALELAPGDRRLLVSLGRAGPGQAARLRLSREQHLALRRFMTELVQTAFERAFRSEAFVRDARRGFVTTSVPSGRLRGAPPSPR
ncbi:MAG: DNA repair protein RecO [Planctomycetes bacterium]|nr:DNA repair protein RecO [Planctomycetota bacterium]